MVHDRLRVQLGGPEPAPFTAADLIRLEPNLLGIRGAGMNDMLTVLKLIGVCLPA